MLFTVERDKFGNLIIKIGNKFTWEEAVLELKRLHDVGEHLWKV